MPKTRQQKEEQVIRLTEQLQAAKSVVFADYKGLTMSQLSQLRNQLSEVGGKLSVTKNNLLKISLQSTNYQLPFMRVLLLLSLLLMMKLRLLKF